MAGRKIRDERDARRCMAAAKKAGLSRSEWARQHGIDGRSLFLWGKNLERKGAPRSTKKPGRRKRRAGLVEVIPDRSPAKSHYLIQCGRFAVEVDDGFDEVTLARLLKVIAVC